MEYLYKKQFAIFFSFIILFAPYVSRAELVTGGKDWKTWPEADKFIYIMGYYTGVDYGATKLFMHLGSIGITDIHKIPSFDEYSNFKKKITSYDIGQIVAGIDTCYADFKNIHLPIQACVDFAEMSIRGVEQKNINSSLQTWRSVMEKYKTR